MKKEDAQEYTESLGQIGAGWWRQIALAKRLGVPKALALTLEEWVNDRLGGYIRLSIPERIEAARELADKGETTRGIGTILGVDHSTIVKDLRGEKSPDKNELTTEMTDSATLSDVRNKPNGEKSPMAVHYSSENPDWETPVAFFQKLNQEFNFALDVCATTQTAKCPNFFSRQDNGLSKVWEGACWMNPPYGQEIEKWVQKAYEESQKSAVVVCLVPSRTDTSWWHQYVMNATEIRFVRGRLRFVGSEASAPFPSAVVIFQPGRNEPKVSAIDK